MIGLGFKPFQAAVKKNPALFQAWGSLGYAYRKVGNYPASLEAYGKALEIEPNYTPAIEYRAEAYLALNRLDEVILFSPLADAAGCPRTILGMDLLLPEADVSARGRTVIAEQRFEALRPGKRTGSYIPIPNSIIRSPGNDRKMFRALNLAAFRNFSVSFMFVGRPPGSWILASGWVSCGCLVSLNFGR